VFLGDAGMKSCRSRARQLFSVRVPGVRVPGLYRSRRGGG